VSVVWTTSSVACSHWTRHRPTAAAGRLHTITSRELGPVAHARPPSMAYAPLSPYDRPLPCHQTRTANSSSTLLSFASDPEIGKGCDLLRVLPKRNPTILLSAHRTQLLATYLDDGSKPSRLDSYHTERLIFSPQPHFQGHRSLFSLPSHACISARYTRLSQLLLGLLTNIPHLISRYYYFSTTPSP